MEASVRDYVTEYPQADYKAIVARFGTPEQLAESYIEEMETAELLDGMRIRQKLMHVLLCAITLIVLIWFGFTATAYYRHEKKADGYAVVEIIVIDETIVAEGEFQ